MHIVWLIGTEDWSYAFETLKIKLPLLILPIIIGTSDDIQSDKAIVLLKWFIGSIVAATLFFTIAYYGWLKYKIYDMRQISLFISHIRFSLLIVVAILILMHWIKTADGNFNKKHFLYLILILWLFFFLSFMKALTGITILVVTLFIILLVFVNRIENELTKILFIGVMYAVPFFSIITLINVYNKYYHSSTPSVINLPKYTANGNPYYHDTTQWQIENGNKVWTYICEPELKKEWNKRSKISYDSLDRKGQPLKNTLIRYMTSINLPKDSLGMTKMTGKDIINVENGMTNIIYTKKYSIIPRIYEVFWEIDFYKHTGQVDNHSVIQRIVYYRIAVSLIKSNFVFGVGTGDLPKEYLKYYQTHDTGIAKERWWQTHNQYLRVFVTFGVIGFAIFLIAFILPPFYERKWNSFYFLMVFLIIMLSFINEDTLETQAGATFVAYFYSLFLWGTSRKLE
jgi:hypothetical protein